MDRDVEKHICRICFKLTDLLLPIFEGEGLENDLPTKIRHLPLAVTLSDGLPTQVCYKCTDTILSWDTLVAACLETDKKLRALFKLQDSDDEPLVTPKKRKLEEVKQNSRPRRKKRTPKKYKDEMAVEVKAEHDSTLMDVTPDLMDSDDGEVDGNLEVIEGGEVKCDECGKVYKRKTALDKHLRQVHGQDIKVEMDDEKKTWKCDVCGHVYKNRANLDRHVKSEHLNNQVECIVCHASVNAKKLVSHLRVMHGVKSEHEQQNKYKCKLCDKWFSNKFVRNSHIKESHTSQNVKCKLCDFEGLQQMVKRHRRDVHTEKRFPCTICDNSFKTLHTLKMHMTAHSDLRCYTCDICGMGFKRLNNVRDHMKCHQEKSNQCQICGNFFARKRYLAIHEKTIHNFYADGVEPEEKGFECGTCGAKLKWKKNLLAHMRIHTGEKPYVCKICKKDFICHGSLRTHMTKHNVCITDKTVEALLSTVSMGEEMKEAPPHLQIENYEHFHSSTHQKTEDDW